jgi:signal transduction histidine kinase
MAMRRRGRTAVIRELEGAMAMMREELEAKDSFADYGEASASMVHDLKNALFSTMGYTARLIQETSQLKNAVGDEAARPIDRMVWHMPVEVDHPQTAIRQGDWKLLYYWDTKQAQLFDLSKDMREAHDLSSEQADRTKAMLAVLIGNLIW